MGRNINFSLCAFALVGALHVSGASAATENVLYSFCAKESCRDGDDPAGPLIDVHGTLYGVTVVGGGKRNDGTVFSLRPTTGKEAVLHSFTHPGNDGVLPSSDLLDVDGTLYGTTLFGVERNHSCNATGCGAIFSVDRKNKEEKVVYAFGSGDSGCFPTGNLTRIHDMLYGTTSSCGEGDGGTIFTLDLSSGSLATLYGFQKDYANSWSPIGSIIKVHDALLGVTLYGGDDYGCQYGCGTIYSFDLATGALDILHSFKSNGTDGNHPLGGMIDVNGTLYGVTWQGGTGKCTVGCGTLYSIRPHTGAETIVHSFQDNGSDGIYPNGNLINVNGMLYGVTEEGGSGSCSTGCGTVYSIDPASGTETIVYSFQSNGIDGSIPSGGLLNIDGTLYGVTAGGGKYNAGTVFQVVP